MSQHYNKAILLFFAIFLHVSVLDLFFVTSEGPVFLWEENSQFLVIATHLVIAVMVALLCLAISTFRIKYKKGALQMSDKMLWVSSMFMLVVIAVILI